jgi:protein SCO1/2
VKSAYDISYVSADSFVLIDPDNDFVECIGRQDTPESAAKVILEHIKDWQREGKPLKTE